MAKKSKQEICAALEAMNPSLKQPINYAEDESYDDLLAKYRIAEEQLNAEPKPVQKAKAEHVALGKGNNEYGRAINKLIDDVAALKNK